MPNDLFYPAARGSTAPVVVRPKQDRKKIAASRRAARLNRR